jgi:type IX secretion system PorP/SprF family membrane protein
MQIVRWHIRYACGAFFLIVPYLLSAQQEPQFSQYMFNRIGFNPGVAGTSEAICAFGLYRQQWVGFEDDNGNKVAPVTYTITVDAPIRILKGGVGLAITSDKLGFEDFTSVKLGYAYHIKTGNGKLGLGLMATFNDKTVDFSSLTPVDEDPLISKLGEENDMLIDAAFGAYYLVPDQYYVGLSSTQLLESTGKSLGDVQGEQMKLKQKRHYFLTAGYKFGFPGNSSFSIDPSILIKTDLGSIVFDLTAILNYKERFWGGFSYRFDDAFVAIIGMEYKNIRIGYSYDLTTSTLGGSYSSGTHEVMAGYCFKLDVEKLRQSYKNTRFL